MARQSIATDIEAIIIDKSLSAEEQVTALKKMYTEVRAQMRAATESAMVDADNLGEDLRQIEEALESVEARTKLTVEKVDDDGPATL